jgi:hypothetical protein
MINNMIFRSVLIVLAAAVLFALISYYNNKQSTQKSERFYQMASTMDNNISVNDYAQTASEKAGVIGVTNETEAYFMPKEDAIVEEQQEQFTVQPNEPLGSENYKSYEQDSKKLSNDCFPKDRLTADDLLPKDAANSKWAQVNPAGQGDVKDQNFLTAGYMVGINTVGSSLKNANLQLRSEPVIPKVSVGPFLNSTYEASDALRRPLEIGGDC